MKKRIALLLALILALSMTACAFGGNENPHNDEDSQTKKSFTVTVVHSDGTTKDFSYETTEKYVGPVLQKAGLIEGNKGQYGLEITKVDGEKAVYAEDKAYWAVYEGEEYALQGIDSTPVVDGRVYKLVYTGA